MQRLLPADVDFISDGPDDLAEETFPIYGGGKTPMKNAELKMG